MKKITWIILTLIISIYGAFALNKSVEGNGNIKTEIKTLETFSKVYINMDCDINITTGGMPMAEIITDKNILPLVKLEVKNHTLSIETKSGYWLQKIKPTINISMPYINELTTYGQQTDIGIITVSGIDVDEFQLDIFYGNIILEGKTNSLKIKSSNNGYYSKSGKIDASALIAKSVDADIEGSNSAVISVTEKLSANLKHDARIEYKGNPSEVKLSGKAAEPISGVLATEQGFSKPTKPAKNQVDLEYISVRVVNNTISCKNFIIKGPNGTAKGFGYGFPLMPFAGRNKNVPVGTVIYLEVAGLPLKKLVEIESKDKNQTINLF